MKSESKYKIVPKKKRVSRIIKILSKEFSGYKRPTLRRMSRSKNAFKVLISCLLSLRIKDETTEKVVNRLFKFISRPEDVVKIPIRKLEKLIYSSGYYKKKSRVLKDVSRIILKKYGGKVPFSKSELLSIKGVGSKTANIILSFIFDKPVIPVDTNVHRISNRLGIVKTKSPEQTERFLEEIVPEKFRKEINTLFILHGKTICLPRFPICSKCPIKKYCRKINVKEHF